MKTYLNLLLVIVGLLMSNSLLSQTKSVLSFTKISATGNSVIPLQTNDMFGTAVDSIGDLDGDGITDLIVGAFRDSDGGINRGAVYILFMNNDKTVRAYQKISSTQGNFSGVLEDGVVFGIAVCGLGDLDGDGVLDVAVGSEYDNDGGYWNGAVWILFLNTNGSVKAHQKISATEGNFSGTQTKSSNDSLFSPDYHLHADTLSNDTLVEGGKSFTSGGGGLLLSGTCTFGSDIELLGDLDGDGIQDIAVGARRDNDWDVRAGAVWILYLNQNGTVKAYSKISGMHGGFPGILYYEDFFGKGVTRLDDMDYDGVPELAVGAFLDDDGGADRGALYILFLNSNGTVKSYQKISSTEGNFTGQLNDDDWFGFSEKSIGDVDSDGVKDLIVGSRNDDDGGTDRGAAWILYMNMNGTVKSYEKISSTQSGFTGQLNDYDYFGTGVACLGDKDNDGNIDLFISAYGTDDGNENSGAAWIMNWGLPVLTTKLIDADCGATNVALNQTLTANPITGATQYEFLVTNTSTNLSASVIKPFNHFQLFEIPEIGYNTTYSINVRVYINTQVESYGDSCFITTSDIPPVYYNGMVFVKTKNNYPYAIQEYDPFINTFFYSTISNFDSIVNVCGIFKIEKLFKSTDSKFSALQNIYKIYFNENYPADSLNLMLNQSIQLDYTERVPIYRSCVVPTDDPAYVQNQQPYLSIINAQSAWDAVIDGGYTFDNNIKIAIVDNGVNINHEDLTIWNNSNEIPDNDQDDDNNGFIDDSHGWDVADHDNDPLVPYLSEWFHGTHVAGIAGATTNNQTGIASISRGIKIIPVKCRKDNSTNGDLLNVEQGVFYAIKSGADVINMSFGAYANSTSLEQLISNAITNNPNLIFVASAGNLNTQTPHFPSDYPGVISVGATNNDDSKADDSNYGSEIDLMAPGVEILSCWNEPNNDSYNTLSGTSMSAPMVSGLCALMLSVCPECTATQIENCMKMSAVDIDDGTLYENLMGAGRINSFDAINCLLGTLEAYPDFFTEYEYNCTGMDVQFQYEGTGTTPTTWAWTFTDGDPSTSNLQNPIVTFSTAGSHLVTLTVSNNNGSNYITHTVNIIEPSINVSQSVQEMCNGNNGFITVEFINGNPPFNFTYTDYNSIPHAISGITQNPYTFIVNPPDNAPSSIYTITSFSSFPSCTVLSSENVTFSTAPCECTPNYNNNWYFGNNAQLQFNPILQSGFASPMIAPASCASISDAGGSFLFASNGESIFFSNGSTINGLNGNSLSSQGVIILPKPLTENIYYIFTVDNIETGYSLLYHEVDLTNANSPIVNLNNPISLPENVTHKITWTWDNNGYDYWIIVNNRNNFYSIPVTSNGIGNYVVSSITNQYPLGLNNNGCMKVSDNGSYLAATYTSSPDNSLSLFLFNNQNGNINFLTGTFVHVPSGIDFTTDNKYIITNELSDHLYIYEISQNNTLIQHNQSPLLCTGTDMGSLQRHPFDNLTFIITEKINNVLSCLNYNETDQSFLFTPVYITGFSGAQVLNGLPQFIPVKPVTLSLVSTQDDCNNNCLGSVVVAISGGSSPYTVQIGNQSISASELTTLNNLCAGNHTIVVSDNSGCTATLNIIINSFDFTALQIETTNTCIDLSQGSINITMSGGVPPYSYNWVGSGFSSNVEDPTGLSAGTYYCTITDAHGCSSPISVIIDEFPLPSISINYTGSDILCNGGSLLLNAVPGTGLFYQWQLNGANIPGATSSTLTVSQAGNYSVAVVDINGCSNTSTVVPVYAPLSYTFSILQNCIFVNEIINFNAPSNSYITSYHWDFGDGTTSTQQNPSHSFPAEGYYMVTLTIIDVCGSQTVPQLVYILPNECSCNGSSAPFTNYTIHEGDPLTSISSDLTLPVNQIIESTINVESGGILAIQSGNTRFGPMGRIVVKKGGVVIISPGAVLTSLDPSCPCMWQGIEVWGTTGQPSTNITQHGYLIIAGDPTNNVYINNAHIGVLLGARDYCVFTGAPHCSGPFNLSLSGGVIRANDATFFSNGIGIKFILKDESESSTNSIKNCRFNSTALIDNNYSTCKNSLANPYAYPNIHNPYNGFANNTCRSTIGIWQNMVDGVTFENNQFVNIEIGMDAFDAKFNVSGGAFSKLRYGIRINNTISGIDNSHTFNNLINFDQFRQEPPACPLLYKNVAAAIQINAGIGDVIDNNNFGTVFSQMLLNHTGIQLLNSSNFKITNNAFQKFRTGILTYNSASNGGLIGPNISGFGNIFTQCQKGIVTTGNNSHLTLRCNNSDNLQSDFITNWENNGMLANQGSIPLLPFGYSTNNDRWLAGNEFSPELDAVKRLLSSNSQYNYFRHSTDVLGNALKVTPNVSGSPIQLHPTNIQKTFTSCLPIIIWGNSHPPGKSIESDDPEDMLAILDNELNYLRQQYQQIASNIDHGKTAQHIIAINSNTPTGQLKNLLVNNSPLSDEVITVLLNKPNALSPGNFKLVMERNLPVSDNVQPLFLARINSLPSGIANQLRNLQVSNPDYTTLSTLQRNILQYEMLRNQAQSSLVQQLIGSGSKADAIQLLEAENTLVANQLLAATYLSDGNYANARNKLAQLPVSDPAVADFITLTTLMIELGENNNTLFDLNDVQLQVVSNLASKCPSSIATANAQAILTLLYNAEFDLCEDNVARYMNPETVSDFLDIETDDWYLGDNYPNPFNNTTTIPYYIPYESKGRIIISDINGKELQSYSLAEGYNNLQIETINFSSGLYFYSIEINNAVFLHKKMTVIK